MNAKEFFDKVCTMRQLQKEFFKTRDKFTMDKARKVEREVDAEIERVKRITEPSPRVSAQTNIFDQPEAENLV